MNEIEAILVLIAVIWVVVVVARALWYAFTAKPGSSATSTATPMPPAQPPVPQAPVPGAQKTTAALGATSSDRLGDEAADLMRAGYIVNVFELEPGMAGIEFDEYGQIKSGTQPDMCLLVTVPLAMVDGTTLMAFVYFLIWDRSQFPDRAPEVRSEITQERSGKTDRWEVHVESPSLAAWKSTTRFRTILEETKSALQANPAASMGQAALPQFDKYGQVIIDPSVGARSRQRRQSA